MIQAAKNIGNTELENKFSESIKLLKRDIVFAASLYLWKIKNKVIFRNFSWFINDVILPR